MFAKFHDSVELNGLPEYTQMKNIGAIVVAWAL